MVHDTGYNAASMRRYRYKEGLTVMDDRSSSGSLGGSGGGGGGAGFGAALGSSFLGSGFLGGMMVAARVVTSI